MDRIITPRDHTIDRRFTISKNIPSLEIDFKPTLLKQKVNPRSAEEISRSNESCELPMDTEEPLAMTVGTPWEFKLMGAHMKQLKAAQ